MIRKGLEIMSNTNSPLQSKDQIKSSNINLEYMDFIGKINLRIRDVDTDILNKVIEDFIIDNKEFIKDTNWKAPYSLDQGIKKTCIWYKRRFKL